MAITVKEVVVKALIEPSTENKKDKEKEETCCDESKKQEKATQDAVDMVANMLKNEKER
jgi:hypothetical protein